MATFRIPPDWRELDHEANGMARCACGCGQTRRVVDARGRQRRYIYGHVGDRPQGRRWTVRDDDRLLTLWERGTPDREIARKLGRTQATVVARRQTILQRLGRGDQLYTRDVARIFGVTQACVRNWIRRGWLRAGHSGYLRVCKGKLYSAWWTSSADVEAFMRREDLWPRWWPEEIRDPHWRALADEIRGAVRFLTVPEVGRLIGFCDHAVMNRLRRGELRGIKGSERTGRSCWYVRSDWLPDSATGLAS